MQELSINERRELVSKSLYEKEVFEYDESRDIVLTGVFTNVSLKAIKGLKGYSTETYGLFIKVNEDCVYLDQFPITSIRHLKVICSAMQLEINVPDKYKEGEKLFTLRHAVFNDED